MSVAGRQSVVMTLSCNHLDKVTFNLNRLYRFAVMCAKGALKRAAWVIFNTTLITLPRCVWLCHKVCSHANMLEMLTFLFSDEPVGAFDITSVSSTLNVRILTTGSLISIQWVWSQVFFFELLLAVWFCPVPFLATWSWHLFPVWCTLIECLSFYVEHFSQQSFALLVQVFACWSALKAGGLSCFFFLLRWWQIPDRP